MNYAEWYSAGYSLLSFSARQEVALLVEEFDDRDFSSEEAASCLGKSELEAYVLLRTLAELEFARSYELNPPNGAPLFTLWPAARTWFVQQ